MRLASDRRHIVLPVIGRLRSKENIRRLQRLVTKGRARILWITLTEHGGRLFVSIATIVAPALASPASPGPLRDRPWNRVGVGGHRS
jgi:putative transposase